ncbi:MAG: hypothetical protein WC906_01505 [Parcubacteria group bacterium]
MDIYFGNLEIGDEFKTKGAEAYAPFTKIQPMMKFGLHQSGKSLIESREINATCGEDYYSFAQDTPVVKV